MGQSQAFTGRRLTVFACGGIQAVLLPGWLDWLHTTYPETAVRCVVTRSAMRFTTPLACASFNGGQPPLVDEWRDDIGHALHVDLATWPDGIIVHPATFHTVSRLALGLCDTPMTLAIQCTEAPVVVCPSLPPGGNANPAYRQHVDALSERVNFAVLPPVQGVSVTTGDTEIGTAALFVHAMAALEDLRRAMRS